MNAATPLQRPGEGLSLCWATPDTFEFGNGFGYARHNLRLRQAIEALGVTITNDAPVALHICYPTQFRPIEGRRNLLFTMWETENPPPSFRAAFEVADGILTPSTWVAGLFRPLTDKPLYVVPHGVDDHFIAVARPRPRSRPFRWLWVGAHNFRKGFHTIQQVHAKYFRLHPKVEFYLKFTDIDPEYPQRQAEALMLGEDPESVPFGSVRQVGNFIMDSRRVSDDELLAIYAAADGFLFPTLGEGAGLTLMEAMRTALPCIAPLRSGETEFADTSVVRRCKTLPPSRDMEFDDTPDVGSPWTLVLRHVDPESLATEMAWCMAHPTAARRMGHAAHRRTQPYTWRAAGLRVLEVLRAHSQKEG